MFQYDVTVGITRSEVIFFLFCILHSFKSISNIIWIQTRTQTTIITNYKCLWDLQMWDRNHPKLLRFLYKQISSFPGTPFTWPGNRPSSLTSWPPPAPWPAAWPSPTAPGPSATSTPASRSSWWSWTHMPARPKRIQTCPFWREPKRLVDTCSIHD